MIKHKLPEFESKELDVPLASADKLSERLAKIDDHYTHEEWDDMQLKARMKSFFSTPIEGEFDPHAESKNEEKWAILNTVIRQLSTGSPSKESLAFIALGLAKYVETFDKTKSRADLIDLTFFSQAPTIQGGQELSEDKLRQVCRAYQNVIDSEVFQYEKGERTPIRNKLTREILAKAKRASITEYYGTDQIDKDCDYADKFKDTVKPILKKGGVYINPNDLRRRIKKGGE